MQVLAFYQKDTLINVRNFGALILLGGAVGAFGLGWRAAGWVLLAGGLLGGVLWFWFRF